MNDRLKILSALAVFLGVAAFPVWYNFASGRSSYRPDIVIKSRGVPGRDSCVMPVAYMRSSHMALLNDWREAVVRTGDRNYTSPDGRRFQRSLTGTCLDCHANKTSFCDRCHDYAAVQPNCWDCHVAPHEEAQ